MKVEEQEKRDETNPTEECLNDLPATDEQALKTTGGGTLNFTKVMLRTEYDPHNS